MKRYLHLEYPFGMMPRVETIEPIDYGEYAHCFHCKYCGSDVKTEKAYCPQCHAPLEDDRPRYSIRMGNG